MADAADFETKASYALRLRATDQWGVFGEKAFTLTVTNVNEGSAEDSVTTRTYTLMVIRQTTFAAWAASHGATDPLADPDGGGLNTLLEYAFGLNPQAPGTSSNLPRSETISVGENKTVLRIVLTLPKVTGGGSYDVEFSNDPGMSGVNTAGAYLTVDNGDGTKTVVVHDIPPPDSSFPARFGRVRIVKAE